MQSVGKKVRWVQKGPLGTLSKGPLGTKKVFFWKTVTNGFFFGKLYLMDFVPKGPFVSVPNGPIENIPNGLFFLINKVLWLHFL